MESKKLAPMRILELLRRYTDADHPMMQEELVARLRDEYGIEIERKAVGRDLTALKEAGFDIVSGRKGSYLAERPFEDSELRLLIDGVLSSRYMTQRHSKDLIEKLIAQSNEYFRAGVKHVCSVNAWSKTENRTVFYNIDVLAEALKEKRRVRFQYNKYRIDKKLHPSGRHEISVLQLLLHNQRYYAMAYEEQWKKVCFFRIDRITAIEKLAEPATDVRGIEGYGDGIDYRALARMPYMFSDAPEQIELLADADIVDQIIDWLGRDIGIEAAGEGKVRVTCTVSPSAMEYWAMQYLKHVDVVAPAFLRARIRKNLAEARKRYRD